MPYLKLHAPSLGSFRLFFKTEGETKFLQQNNSIHDTRAMHVVKMERSKWHDVVVLAFEKPRNDTRKLTRTRLSEEPG
jgi:hypothetical protein